MFFICNVLEQSTDEAGTDLSLALQGLSVIDSSTNKPEKAKQRENELKASLLLAQPLECNFLSLVEDILQNTMLNLIQEAVFDEFAILAEEPIRFLSSPTRSGFGS